MAKGGEGPRQRVVKRHVRGAHAEVQHHALVFLLSHLVINLPFLFLPKLSHYFVAKFLNSLSSLFFR